MTDDELFAVALAALGGSWATRSIPARFERPGYDAATGRRICRLMFEKCGRDADAFRRALDDFVLLSEEFVRLQFELDRTGRYRYSSYADVSEHVYDNAELMDRRYLNGLFLSTAFWVNHLAIFTYFVSEFCSTGTPCGRVLEVPSGTGLFVSEFASRNPGWTAQGIDISTSSVAFSTAIVRHNGSTGAEILRFDVFDLPAREQYDRIICGELLEHLEDPPALLEKLMELVRPQGRIFLTTAIWAASIDHIYLFRSAKEVRAMLERTFTIESELVLNVRDGRGPEDEKTPINYACVLAPKR